MSQYIIIKFGFANSEYQDGAINISYSLIVECLQRNNQQFGPLYCYFFFAAEIKTMETKKNPTHLKNNKYHFNLELLTGSWLTLHMCNKIITQQGFDDF